MQLPPAGRLLRLVALLGLLLLPLPASAGAPEQPWAVSLYGGRLTSNHWEELFDHSQVEFVDTHLVAAALSRRIGGWRQLRFEAEGQAVRYFGDQDHWEFNLLASARWERFPWDRTIDTDLAFGIGPSYATQVPPVEVELDNDSQRWLVYWMLELALAPPSHPQFALIGRIHHRSEAFGIVADDGGGNTLALGLRYRF